MTFPPLMAEDTLMQRRLGRLAQRGLISGNECTTFLQLEEFVEHGRRGDKWEEWLASFRQTNDAYIPLLRKVLEGMKAVNEPYAYAKYAEFMSELGTMTPGVYSNPWGMTLNYLDGQVGDAEEIKRFYGL